MRDRLTFGAVALLAVGCCAGIPLLLAAGLGVAALAVIGGGALVALALLLGVGFIVARGRSGCASEAHIRRRGYGLGSRTFLGQRRP